MAGSTWPEDEEVFTHLVKTRKDISFIFAPHEIYDDHMKSIQRLFPHRILYSELASGANAGDSNVLVIDNFGMLSKLYHYGTICYIGGGFSNGIHNILEAAVHEKPLIFGPSFYKFQEAVDLLERGGAETVESAIELEKIVTQWLGNTVEMAERGKVSADYVKGKGRCYKKDYELYSGEPPSHQLNELLNDRSIFIPGKFEFQFPLHPEFSFRQDGKLV